jgi:flagellar protein FliS
LSFTDPYQAYSEGSLAGGNPLQLVIALYEATIESIRQARLCLAMNDIWGRGTAVNKAIKLLTELLVSLDHQRGGDISANLKRLYSYIQCRVIDAHTQKREEPLLEAERLLKTLLEGWYGAAASITREWSSSPAPIESNRSETLESPESGYCMFTEELGELAGSVSATF